MRLTSGAGLRIRRALLVLSVLLCVTTAVVSRARWDWSTAFTLLPLWLWVLLGLMLAALGWSRATQRWAIAVVALWFLFVLLICEEPRSMLRASRKPTPEWETARKGGKAFRIVSLNCAGTGQAAAEVEGYDPDIVLLQESPSRSSVENLAKKLFGEEGDVAWGVYASIVVRGKVSEVTRPFPEDIHCVEARARLASGIEVHLVSLRLSPYSIRADLWSPDCWRDQAATRRGHRDQLNSILKNIPHDKPVIVGGDFNEPSGDPLLRRLLPRFRDSFTEAGTGWGNTLLNKVPLLRIDQIWASDHFRAESARARRTVNSDHRLVVCELSLQNP